jgi:antitoxin (DNA-binding transcriptional repressor) of toxin-antitoxin stability system
MKVNIGQLKTHLSQYVKELRNGAEPIEVCVREATVAYLTGAEDRIEGRNDRDLKCALEHAGLAVSQWGRKSAGRRPSVDAPRRDGNTVVEIRRTRDW